MVHEWTRLINYVVSASPMDTFKKWWNKFMELGVGGITLVLWSRRRVALPRWTSLLLLLLPIPPPHVFKLRPPVFTKRLGERSGNNFNSAVDARQEGLKIT